MTVVIEQKFLFIDLLLVKVENRERSFKNTNKLYGIKTEFKWAMWIFQFLPLCEFCSICK